MRDGEKWGIECYYIRLLLPTLLSAGYIFLKLEIVILKSYIITIEVGSRKFCISCFHL